MTTKWEDLFKIRLSNIVDPSMDLHDVIKILIVRKLLRKYRRREFIRIYTEFKLDGMTPDVFMENLKDKSITCWEIQKEITGEWTKKTIEKYNNYKVPFMNSVDLIIVPIKKCPSDKVSEINKWLDDYVF